MIDINKPLKTKVFGTAVSVHEAATMKMVVQIIILLHPPYTQQAEIIYNGGKSSTFRLLLQN